MLVEYYNLEARLIPFESQIGPQQSHQSPSYALPVQQRVKNDYWDKAGNLSELCLQQYPPSFQYSPPSDHPHKPLILEFKCSTQKISFTKKYFHSVKGLASSSTKPPNQIFISPFSVFELPSQKIKQSCISRFIIFEQQPMSKLVSKQPKKEVRKPVSDSFAPKRLAINFDPPTIIMQYLVVDNGKLYHHKMRLDSIMRKPHLTRIDVLDYIKNKHYLYFLNGKIKDPQLLKFIDKIMARTTKHKPQLQQIKEEEPTPSKYPLSPYNQDGDFDYLNDDEYEQDYEDYQEPDHKPNPKDLMKKEPPKLETMFNKNTFMTYCQEYEDENEEGGAEWDLEMEGSADFV